MNLKVRMLRLIAELMFFYHFNSQQGGIVMKRIRFFEILKCRQSVFRMPERIRKKQCELRGKINSPGDKGFDSDRLFNASLPIISSDEAWAKLTSSEKELVMSLEYGSVPEAAESYHIAQYQNRNAKRKS